MWLVHITIKPEGECSSSDAAMDLHCLFVSCQTVTKAAMLPHEPLHCWEQVWTGDAISHLLGILKEINCQIKGWNALWNLRSWHSSCSSKGNKYIVLINEKAKNQWTHCTASSRSWVIVKDALVRLKYCLKKKQQGTQTFKYYCKIV